MPSAKPVYVLGVGCRTNGAACLLKDGEIAVAIEKERLTKIKNDGGNDTFAIAYCLSAAGIGWDEVALVVQNANFGSFAYGNGWYRGDAPSRTGCRWSPSPTTSPMPVAPSSSVFR